MYFQDVTGCGGSTYDIPGNGGLDSVHSATRSWTAPVTASVSRKSTSTMALEIDTTKTTRSWNTRRCEINENPHR